MLNAGSFKLFGLMIFRLHSAWLHKEETQDIFTMSRKTTFSPDFHLVCSLKSTENELKEFPGENTETVR